MGYDHAEQKELGDGGTGSSSGSDGSTDDQFVLERRRTEEDRIEDERKDTLSKLPGKEQEEGHRLKRTHAITLGPMIRLRADDDDDPTDWWFASTAIPLIAATFAPMANVLSIAALVEYWRNRIPNEYANQPSINQDLSVGIQDPKWYFDLNVASLVFGFGGNLFLLFNFTMAVQYIVALPASIICFYFASGILIGLTSSMNIYIPPDHGEVYSQGFWHAIIAACLYLFNSMILMINMLGYFLGHYPQHFTLTDEQRSLILQAMMFFFWLAGGAGVFTAVEGWSYPDSLYFCDVTILTIGFGDIYAPDDVGRGLVFPYSIGGTIILGLMVSSIHKFAGELSKDKVIRKHIEKNRVNTLSRATTMTEEGRELQEVEKKDWREGHRPSISAPIDHRPAQDIDNRRVEFQEPEKQAGSPGEEPSPHQFLNSRLYKSGVRPTWKFMKAPVKQLKKVTSFSQKVIIMREEKDRFDAMRRVQENAVTFKKWYALGLSVIAFGLLWCLGAMAFWAAEKHTQGLSYFQALYFCYVSLLTIGYGDISPRSNAGKPFFVVWSLIAVPTMTILISDMGHTVVAAFKQGTFKLADFTVLPKQGIWRDIMLVNPWLWNLLKRRAEKKRIKQGMPVGPPEDEDPFPKQTIEQLAHERLNEHQLARKLAFAIRNTADDLHSHATKTYTYEEWVEYTRLIRFTKMDMGTLEQDEDQEGVVEWDWLGENSPMLSEQSEAEWILDRLCESLLRLLRKHNLNIEPERKAGSQGGFNSFSSDGPRHEQQDEGKDRGPNGEDITDAAGNTMVDEAQERRQRAPGAEAMINFFTGDRRGTHAYAQASAQWSKKARENRGRRRRSSGAKPRQGPFARLHRHNKKDVNAQAGVAALHLEDQVVQKRCGHLKGKELVSEHEYQARIRAAVAMRARIGSDIVIIARTDALAIHGLDVAITRMKQALSIGADVVFIEAIETLEQARTICETFKGTPVLYGMVQGSKSPQVTVEEAKEIGFKIIIYAGLCLAPVYHSISQTMRALKKSGNPDKLPEGVDPHALFRACGMDELLAFDTEISGTKS